MALFASAVRKGRLLRGDLHVPNLSVVILRHFEGEKRAGTDHVCDEKIPLSLCGLYGYFGNISDIAY